MKKTHTQIDPKSKKEKHTHTLLMHGPCSQEVVSALAKAQVRHDVDDQRDLEDEDESLTQGLSEVAFMDFDVSTLLGVSANPCQL